MIPKKIHYCWFGGNPLPEDAKKYIETWKKYCPDYEIIEWNENNFDLFQNQYVKEAYENKKWAFITDYVRLWAIYNYGGIYMDTDVEVLAPLDVFLKHSAFSGFESSSTIPTGIMGGEKNNNWFKLQLDYYNNRHFVKDDGSLDLTTNVTTITKITKDNYNIQLENKYVDLCDVVFYPSEYFCPKDWKTGQIILTQNTYTIHHFAGSWRSVYNEKYNKLKNKISKKFGNKVGFILSIPSLIRWQIKDYGIRVVIKKICLYFFKRR